MDAKWMSAAIVGLGVTLVAPGTLPGAALVLAQEAEARAEAQADEDDEMLQEMMVFSIPRESANFYADLMDLDELQREVALEMHREYFGSYRDAAVKMRDVVRSIEESMTDGETDWEKVEAMMADMMKVAVGFIERSVNLGNQYVDDLGALAATEAQQAGHQRVVRTRAREMAVAMSSMNGGLDSGMIDLVAIGRGMDPPVLPAENATGDAAAAQQALYEYEVELGEQSAAFVERALTAFREMAKAMSEGSEDAMLESRFEDELEAMAKGISAVNERYARRVHAMLPNELRDAWDAAYKQARWPEVYAPGDVDRAYDAALALSDLTEDQRGAIEATMSQYVREVEPANKAWIDAVTDLDEARQALGEDSDQDDWMAYQAKNEAVQQRRSDRMALDERFVERVLAVLTPEQQEAMPDAAGGAVDADAVIREMGGG